MSEWSLPLCAAPLVPPHSSVVEILKGFRDTPILRIPKISAGKLSPVEVIYLLKAFKPFTNSLQTV
jgi:hypothetical protein